VKGRAKPSRKVRPVKKAKPARRPRPVEREEFDEDSIPEADSEFEDTYGMDDDLLMPGDELELSYETYAG
jgi:hypothetical protein